MVVDCKIYKSYKDDIKSLKCPEFDFMTALLRGQGYPTLLRIFLRFGIIRYCVPKKGSTFTLRACLGLSVRLDSPVLPPGTSISQTSSSLSNGW